jgi:hypothetical protein
LRIFGHRSSTLARRLGATVAVVTLCAACGKKGPPLAPLNMAPEAPQAVAARRLGDTVYMQLTVPAKNVAGSGPYSVDHLEVYAVTLAPGSDAPANRVFLTPPYVVAKIPVRRPVDPDAEPVEGSEEQKGPAPGEVITFVETITPALLVPQQMSKPAAEPVAPPAPAPTAPAAATAPPAAPAGPPVLTRLYTVRGVARNGARGPAAARVSVPLLAAPPPPRPGPGSFDQSSVTITWSPPPVPSDEAPGVSYNVYDAAATSTAAGAAAVAPAPLNAKPLEVTAYTHGESVPGQEHCFVVRTVATVGTSAVEGDPSPPICVTPADLFPPAAPTGLAAVAGPGAINLIWDASTDADLAGYVILRGEAPGDTLQALTPQPIRETRYVDRAVQPGVAYVYAVVAVDRATPPNRSALSNKVQETAR